MSHRISTIGLHSVHDPRQPERVERLHVCGARSTDGACPANAVHRLQETWLCDWHHEQETNR